MRLPEQQGAGKFDACNPLESKVEAVGQPGIDLNIELHSRCGEGGGKRLPVRIVFPALLIAITRNAAFHCTC